MYPGGSSLRLRYERLYCHFSLLNLPGICQYFTEVKVVTNIGGGLLFDLFPEMGYNAPHK